MLARRKPPRMNVKEPTVFRSEPHKQFVRGFVCVLFGKDGHECDSKVRACHVRTGTDGGMQMKPSDFWTYPGCDRAHGIQHDIGEPEFERRYGLNLKDIARKIARLSRHVPKDLKP